MVRSTSTEDIFPEIISPSPNASSLGIFGEIPVGHYSGIPNINIPLYEITSGRIKVPLSLSYHASGIRAAQEASWVGLGWTLNAGGIISRSVMGVDDFNDELNKGISGYPGTNDAFPSHTDDGYFTDESGYPIRAPLDYLFYMSNKKDVRPDVFYYNFDSYSGQVVFPKKTYEYRAGVFPAPLILNQDQLTINYRRKNNYNVGAGEWVVIIPDGTRYHFKTAELTRTYCDIFTPPLNPVDRQPEVYTAWYLDKITNTCGDSVEFIYKTNAKIKSQVQGSCNLGKCRNKYPMDGQPWNFSEYSYTVNVVDEIVLQEIRFRGGRVIFDTGDRRDLLYDGAVKPQALTSIQIVNNNQEIIKKFDFTTSYYNDLSYNTALQLRLKLDKIVENNEKTWTFTYNAQSLPDKNTCAIDYWGYYNGMIRNSRSHPNGMPYSASVIPMPHFINPYYSDYLSERFFSPGADRNASDAYAQAGILKRVDYPTGGHTDFEYELHDFYNHDFSFVGSDFKYKYDYYNQYVSEDSELDIEFSVQDAIPCYGTASVFYSGFQCNENAEYPFIDFAYEDFTNLDITWKLLKKGPHDEWQPYSQDTFGNIQCRDLLGKNEARLVFASSLEPGEYRIVMPTYMNTRAGVDLIIPRLKGYDELKGGGLRVKSIKSYDGEEPIITTYRYASPTGMTTGKAHAYPRSVYLPTEMSGTSYGRMSSNIFSLGSPMSGIAVGYDCVLEERRDTDSIIYTKEYSFHNQTDNFGHTNWAPNTPSGYYHESGLPKSIKIWAGDGSFIQEKYYEYMQYPEQPSFIEGLNIVSLHCPSDAMVSLFNFYKYPSEWWYLDSERTIDHTPNGTSNTETKKYEYDPEHHKITSIRTSYGDGKTIMDSYSYIYLPQKSDIPHTVELLYEQNSYAGSNFLKGIRHLYSNLDLSQIKVRGQGQAEYEIRQNILRHDKYHNPVYMLKDGTEKIVYLWGYQGVYPVAQIKNATIEQVLTALGSPGDHEAYNRLAELATPNITLLESLRANLPNAQVWTYTYKPLVGMQKAIDPAGKITYYDYDAFGRLIGIKDNTGDKIQSLEYHYKQ